MDNINNTETINATKPAKTGLSKNMPFSIATIAGAGMLTAVAAVLQFFDFPIPALIPGFIKFDFSDLPALLGAFAYGPVVGIIIELLKNVIRMITGSSSGWVGPLCNFMLGAVFVGFAGLTYSITKRKSDGSKRLKNKTSAFLGAIIGALMMGILSFPINLFITYPQYYLIYHLTEEKIVRMYQAILPSVQNINQCLLIFNLPFTFVKGAVCVIITMLIYKPLSPILHGQLGKNRT